MSLHKQKVKTFWDQNLNAYDLHMLETNHYEAQKNGLRIIDSFIKEPILDLACGTGFLISEIQKNYRNISGNDFSEKMIEEASSRLNSVSLSNNDVEVLSEYSEKSFETLFCCNLFYYIKNREKALERWYELLTENGKLIFFEEHPFINSDSENQFNESKNDLNTLIDPISPGELKKLAIGAGFKKVFEKSTPIDDKHDLFLLVFEK
ncbi:class I SAM-dependent methyltransferase [Patescibacteria group bacterium]|nr:class I SAM-dependent methyltransferase [Patescibacteria group bacterium]